MLSSAMAAAVSGVSVRSSESNSLLSTGDGVCETRSASAMIGTGVGRWRRGEVTGDTRAVSVEETSVVALIWPGWAASFSACSV